MSVLLSTVKWAERRVKITHVHDRAWASIDDGERRLMLSESLVLPCDAAGLNYPANHARQCR